MTSGAKLGSLHRRCVVRFSPSLSRLSHDLVFVINPAKIKIMTNSTIGWPSTLETLSLKLFLA